MNIGRIKRSGGCAKVMLTAVVGFTAGAILGKWALGGNPSSRKTWKPAGELSQRAL
jgi:hypothetical protein